MSKIVVTVSVYEGGSCRELIVDKTFNSLEDATQWMIKLGTGSWEYVVSFAQVAIAG